MERLLQGLRAVAEATRLRILGLCAHGDLSVSELTEILGQSQPRISRHLKLLQEAGLLERHQEGNRAYFRLAGERAGAELARLIVDLMPPDDPKHALDLERLQAVKAVTAARAAAYFRANAANWSQIGSLHVDDARVDDAVRRMLRDAPIGDLLDIGTGNGHMLEVLRDEISSGVGIDTSRDMLNVARANLFRSGLQHCHVRQADMTQLPFPAASFDTVTLRLVLHYAERPEAVIAEAARVLRPGGRMVVVDFAPHDRSELRIEHAHRWLGFPDARVEGAMQDAGVLPVPSQRLEGGAITVVVWLGRAAGTPARRAASLGTAHRS
ncbi:MAG: ArsR/SmtB family transcription factor [Gaiella sp.]